MKKFNARSLSLSLARLSLKPFETIALDSQDFLHCTAPYKPSSPYITV